jgi:hypothetical protein
MAQSGTCFTRRSLGRTILAYLLAGMVMMSSPVSPSSIRALLDDAMRANPEGEDSLPIDPESPEEETSSDEDGLQALAPRRLTRLCARHGCRSSKLLLPWSVLAASRPFATFLLRAETGEHFAGHFLAEGKFLRLWFQSQTC